MWSWGTFPHHTVVRRPKKVIDESPVPARRGDDRFLSHQPSDMQVSGPGFGGLSSSPPHPPTAPVCGQQTLVPRAITRPSLGSGGARQTVLLPQWISNLEVQMAGVGSSVPFRASAWLFYEMTGTFISALAPFFSFSARLQRQATRQEQGKKAHSPLHPCWAGRPGLCVFQPCPFEPWGLGREHRGPG